MSHQYTSTFEIQVKVGVVSNPRCLVLDAPQIDVEFAWFGSLFVEKLADKYVESKGSDL